MVKYDNVYSFKFLVHTVYEFGCEPGFAKA